MNTYLGNFYEEGFPFNPGTVVVKCKIETYTKVMIEERMDRPFPRPEDSGYYVLSLVEFSTIYNIALSLGGECGLDECIMYIPEMQKTVSVYARIVKDELWGEPWGGSFNQLSCKLAIETAGITYNFTQVKVERTFNVEELLARSERKIIDKDPQYTDIFYILEEAFKCLEESIRKTIDKENMAIIQYTAREEP